VGALVAADLAEDIDTRLVAELAGLDPVELRHPPLLPAIASSDPASLGARRRRISHATIRG
jgi:hypothetical protein